MKAALQMFLECHETDLQLKLREDFIHSIMRHLQVNAATTLGLSKSFSDNSIYLSSGKIGAMRHILEMSEAGPQPRMQDSVKV